MRKNELTSIEQLKSQYIGVWGPSDEHWLGLDFIYHNKEYRLHTGSMYETQVHEDENGAIMQFGLYEKICDRIYEKCTHQYRLLDEKKSLDELLESTAIDGLPFKVIIMDDDTVLTGQD